MHPQSRPHRHVIMALAVPVAGTALFLGAVHLAPSGESGTASVVATGPVAATAPGSPAPGAAAVAVPGTSHLVVRVASDRGVPDADVALEELPAPALTAYQRAASVLAQAAGRCHIDWQLLAAIGYVDSGHGTDAGRSLSDQGVVTPALYGAALSVADTDAGQVDGDKRHDRPVGPMMLTPATWAVVGLDADGDGVRDPQDVDDAALAAGVMLCGSHDLSSAAGLRAALWSLDPSARFRSAVLAAYDVYRSAPPPVSETVGVIGARAVLPGPVPSPAGPVRSHGASTSGFAEVTAALAAAHSSAPTQPPTAAGGDHPHGGAPAHHPTATVAASHAASPSPSGPTPSTGPSPSGSASAVPTTASSDPTPSPSEAPSTAASSASPSACATPTSTDPAAATDATAATEAPCPTATPTP